MAGTSRLPQMLQLTADLAALPQGRVPRGSLDSDQYEGEHHDSHP
jgi:hypothetical protein